MRLSPQMSKKTPIDVGMNIRASASPIADALEVSFEPMPHMAFLMLVRFRVPTRIDCLGERSDFRHLSHFRAPEPSSGRGVLTLRACRTTARGSRCWRTARPVGSFCTGGDVVPPALAGQARNRGVAGGAGPGLSYAGSRRRRSRPVRLGQRTGIERCHWAQSFQRPTHFSRC